MNIIREFRNDLLKRREVELALESDKNPGVQRVLTEVGQKYGASEEVISVKSVHGKFGSGRFVAEAFIYDTAEDKLKAEPKKKEAKK